MRHIPDYDGFDPDLHEYVAASFGGDGWTVDPPVHERLMAEALSVFEGELPADFRLEDQIESLEVYFDDDNMAAQFDFPKWEWKESGSWFQGLVKQYGTEKALEI